MEPTLVKTPLDIAYGQPLTPIQGDTMQGTPATAPMMATPAMSGGKSMKRRLRKVRTLRTGIRGRGKYIKGWSTQQPGYHQRTVMMKQCGKKCFLGPRKTFPICSKNTCKRNKKGVYAAYIRAREYMTIKPNSQKYRRITSKARHLLKK